MRDARLIIANFVGQDEYAINNGFPLFKFSIDNF